MKRRTINVKMVVMMKRTVVIIKINMKSRDKKYSNTITSMI